VKEPSVLLELENITKHYPGVTALDHVSLSFDTGEIHAICGENGTGKSTLIKIVTGAIQPTSGVIRYLGEEIRHQNPITSMAKGIGCIYQEFNLIPHLSVAENIFFGREPKKHGFVDFAKMQEQSVKIIQELGLDIDPNMLVEELTVGFQQIVEIAKALSQDVRVLIMDEPSASLTTNELEYLFAIVRKLKKKHVTVIYISHRLEEVFLLSDRVSVLRDGLHITTLKTAETDRNELIRNMVGRPLTDEFPHEETELAEVALEVKNLCSSKLNDISFSVRKGEILGLAGLVGAGRTEVARAIFGADKFDSGEILIHGKPVTINSPEKALSLGVGLIPEDRKQHGILSELSIKHNITFSSLKKFVKGLFITSALEKKEAQDMKNALKIKAPNLNVLVKALSGGNQQKVVLSKILLTNSDIIIFDEPTRGIDVGTKKEFYYIMKDLAKAGKAIIMISSEMPELIGMSDRIIILCEGYLVKELHKEEYSQEIILEYAAERRCHA
jgi:ribose transport system ATP-binding protein